MFGAKSIENLKKYENFPQKRVSDYQYLSLSVFQLTEARGGVLDVGAGGLFVPCVSA